MAIPALAALLVLALIAELALRIGFPCDLYLWSESPFMTDMLKLVNHVPLYGDPHDVNSFVYAPGLQYLTYAILAPFGLALDVRFCRVVNVLLGFGTAGCATVIALRVAERITTGLRRGPFLVGAFSIATLVVFSNFTSAVTHPDNIHMLDATATLMMCHGALRTGSFRMGIGAMIVAGLAVLTKQTAIFTVVGAGVALLVGRRWDARRSALLVGTGLAVTACALLVLVGPTNARFFTFALPVRQGLVWSKIPVLFDDFFRGHRLVLLVLAPACAVELLRADARAGREFLLPWATLFVTAALPTLGPYFKNMGSDNNLWILGFWLLLLVLPLLGPGLLDGGSAPWRCPSLLPLVRLAGFVLLLAAVVPLRLPPSSSGTAYCQDFVARVGRDIAAGKRVLIAHGTSPFILNGVRDVPRDRGNTLLEYMYGNRMELLSDMNERISSGYYDRIYANGAWFFWNTPLIKTRYHEVEKLKGAAISPLLATFPYRWGENFAYNMMDTVVVYDPD